jgi:hypothetical protein
MMGPPLPLATEAETESTRPTIRIPLSTPQVYYRVYNSAGDWAPRYLRNVEVISRWTSPEEIDTDHRAHIQFGRLHLQRVYTSVPTTWEWWLDDYQN